MEDTIKNIFSKTPDIISSQSPLEGHEARFLERLKKHPITSLEYAKPRLVWRKKTLRFLSVAAGIALLFGVFKWGAHTQSKKAQIEAISPSAGLLSDQYALPLAKAIEKVTTGVTPLTKPHIDRAILEISKLEEELKGMETDLLSGGNTRLILQAMVLNYQTRLELLEEVLDRVETINNLNKKSDENI